MSSWMKTKGTQTGEFQLGFDGPSLKNNSGNLQLRNGANTAYVDITSGNIISNGTFQGNATGLTNIPGANVTGFVANASISNIANLAYSVSGANVTGAVGLATYATTANSVAGSNVSGAVSLATYATTANSVAGANVSGAVSLATSATTADSANSVAGANVSGAVGYATVANSVAGANVSGAVAFATVANSVAGANVSGQVGNALVAGTVYTASQPAITNVGTLSSLSLGGAVTGDIIPSANVTYSLGNSTNRFKDLWLSGSTLNLGDSSLSASGTGLVLPSANITTDLVVGGNATVNGNLAVTGNLTYINVVDLRVQDPIIELGGGANGAPLTTNDGMDRGEILHYYTGSAPVDAFMGWKNSAGEFQFGSNVTTTNNVVTINTLGNVRANVFIGNLDGTANIATNLNGSLINNLNVNGHTIAGAPYLAAQLDLNLGASLTATRGLAGPSGGIQLNTGSGDTATNTWTFGYNGNLTLPGNTFAVNYANGTQINLDGPVANANYANIAGVAYSVSGSNVSGTVSSATSATTAGTVTTNAQPNVTSVGTLTSLTVSGTTDLGPVGNVTLTGGAAGYILSTNGSGALTWIATPSSADAWKATSVTVTSGSASTVNVLTLPASAIVDKVSVIVDTVFNGTSPTVTVGVSGGSGFEYANSTDINLKSADRYDMPSQLQPVGSSQSIQAYFTSSGSSAGSARIIVTYSIPS